MIDEATILKAERLHDDLVQLKADIRARYRMRTQQVTVDELRRRARSLAETWLVELAPRKDVSAIVSSDSAADLNVAFTRLLRLSQRAALRTSYETEINAITKDYTFDVVIPLKQARTGTPAQSTRRQEQSRTEPPTFVATAFVGHSFADADKPVVECVLQTLQVLGILATTGQRPQADRISEKVKRLIDAQSLFVGVFTRRERIKGKRLWTTSAWVIDEKAYALGKGKRLILLREEGLDGIGGLQGDYEFIEFSRDKLDKVVLWLVALFKFTVTDLNP